MMLWESLKGCCSARKAPPPPDMENPYTIPANRGGAGVEGDAPPSSKGARLETDNTPAMVKGSAAAPPRDKYTMPGQEEPGICDKCQSHEYLCSVCDFIFCSSCDSEPKKVAGLEGVVCVQCFNELRRKAVIEKAKQEIKPIPKNFQPRQIGNVENSLSKPLTHLEYLDMWQLIGDLSDKKVLTKTQVTELFDRVVQKDMRFVRKYREFEEHQEVSQLVSGWLMILAEDHAAQIR